MSTTAFKLLVFDWDGTLADSLQQIIMAMELAIEDLGLCQRSEERIRSVIGLGLMESASTLYPEIRQSERKDLVERYRHHYLSSNNEVQLFPGVKETITLLNDSGFFLAVATGKSRRGLDRSLLQTGMGDSFQVSRCADETFSKPHPQMLYEIMSNLGMSPEQTLMIGDSEHDLLMAANAGVKAIAANYGAQEAERLLEFNPILSINSIEDLLPLLGLPINNLYK